MWSEKLHSEATSLPTQPPWTEAKEQRPCWPSISYARGPGLHVLFHRSLTAIPWGRQPHFHLPVREVRHKKARLLCPGPSASERQTGFEPGCRTPGLRFTLWLPWTPQSCRRAPLPLPFVSITSSALTLGLWWFHCSFWSMWTCPHSPSTFNKKHGRGECCSSQNRNKNKRWKLSHYHNHRLFF